MFFSASARCWRSEYFRTRGDSMTEYYIPTGRSETELVEKRSRFIGQVWLVSSEEEARVRIEETRKKHYDARHNCWCFRLHDGGVERCSDDGEPQGTAGQPMLNVFQREDVTDVLCVVTRYFGGVLLGAGGLVRAYAAGWPWRCPAPTPSSRGPAGAYRPSTAWWKTWTTALMCLSLPSSPRTGQPPSPPIFWTLPPAPFRCWRPESSLKPFPGGRRCDNRAAAFERLGGQKQNPPPPACTPGGDGRFVLSSAAAPTG